MDTIADGVREQLRSLLRDVRFALVTSRRADGTLRTRPLTMLNDDAERGDELYFFVAAASDVVDDVSADARVNVACADPATARYLSIGGEARVLQNRCLEWGSWAPAARGGAGDARLRLLVVHIGRAQVWDARAGAMKGV